MGILSVSKNLLSVKSGNNIRLSGMLLASKFQWYPIIPLSYRYDISSNWYNILSYCYPSLVVVAVKFSRLFHPIFWALGAKPILFPPFYALFRFPFFFPFFSCPFFCFYMTTTNDMDVCQFCQLCLAENGRFWQKVPILGGDGSIQQWGEFLVFVGFFPGLISYLLILYLKGFRFRNL
jgi:hypothetical protein